MAKIFSSAEGDSSNNWKKILHRISNEFGRPGGIDDAQHMQALLVEIGRLLVFLSDFAGNGVIPLVVPVIQESILDILSRFSPHEVFVHTTHNLQGLTLMAFLLWLVSTPHTLVNMPQEQRNRLLDIMEPITLPHTSQLWSQEIVANWPTDPLHLHLEYPGHQAIITTPVLVDVARLSAALIYQSVRLSLKTHMVQSNIQQPNNGPLNLSGCLSGPLKNIDGVFTTQNSVSQMKGTWSGAFFTPCIVRQDSHATSWGTNIYIFQTSMRYEFREYLPAQRSAAILDEADDNSSAEAFLRAWFPKDFDWYEDAGNLFAYDSRDDRWITYTQASITVSAVEGGDDRIIVGTSIYGSDCHKGYKLHGRVRKRDGLVAFIRQPISEDEMFLGRWLFHGRMYNGRDFVGEWSVTSPSVDGSGSGERGWFSLTRE